MTTFTATAFNLFESIALAWPRIEAVTEAAEHTVAGAPLRMEWVRAPDSNGGRIIRIRWSTGKRRDA